jgi:diguanylate cyclase (GGDEF)-like protein/PAS domain S-box-containing protein
MNPADSRSQLRSLRRLLPVAILLPAFFAALRLEGEALGLYSARAGILIFTIVMSVAFVALVLLSARRIDRAQRERAGAESRARAGEADLRAAEERFRGAFEGAPIGMAIARLDGRFMQVNQALCEITGYSQAELTATTLAAVTHPDDHADDQAGIDALLGGRIAVWRTETRYLNAAGRPIWVSVTATVIHEPQGRPSHLLAQVQDITERRLFEDRLQHMADHDPLTGLLNRRRFEQELDRHAAEVARYGVTGAVIVLDLDHFKYVNDTLGHSVGDELIVCVAGILHDRLRDTDVIARLGGDEFAVLLPKAGREQAESVARSIVDGVREGAMVLKGSRPRRVTASVGIALFGERTMSGEALLVDADLAMYEAKEAGRDRFAHFASDRYEQPRIKARMAWADRIRAALDEERFVLYAQPIRDLRSGQTSQYELLLRMTDENGESIPPGAFLYVAERFDLIQEIDRWVVARAIELIAAHRDEGNELCLEVNVSGKSLGDPRLLDVIERELERTAIKPHCLIFEVTETAAVANIHLARRFGERLAELGCRFALDDFGAGFGSFYYIKHLPFDYLKIDGEFIVNCLESRTDQLVIEAVVRIAQGLGKETIAEFVTGHRQQRFLQRQGVDYAQGHFIGEAQPVDDLIPAVAAVPS